MTHEHGHRHGHSAVPVLDIGGEVGAMVVYLAGDTPSGELEACPLGNAQGRFHTGVHERHGPGGHAWVAVFPEVRAGRYDLLASDGSVLATAAVDGGAVVELDLR